MVIKILPDTKRRQFASAPPCRRPCSVELITQNLDSRLSRFCVNNTPTWCAFTRVISCDGNGTLRFSKAGPSPVICLQTTPPHDIRTDYVECGSGNWAVNRKFRHGAVVSIRWINIATSPHSATQPSNNSQVAPARRQLIKVIDPLPVIFWHRPHKTWIT